MKKMNIIFIIIFMFFYTFFWIFYLINDQIKTLIMAVFCGILIISFYIINNQEKIIEYLGAGK